jgi:hypothetical protein
MHATKRTQRRLRKHCESLEPDPGADALGRICATTIEADDDVGLECDSDWTDDRYADHAATQPQAHCSRGSFTGRRFAERRWRRT